MIWHPVTLLQAIFPFQDRLDMARKSRRWRAAIKDDSNLAIDLIQLGGVLTGQPARLTEGWPTPALPDAATLAYAAGRRDMALQLLALAHLSPSKLQSLMKEAEYDND